MQHEPQPILFVEAQLDEVVSGAQRAEVAERSWMARFRMLLGIRLARPGQQARHLLHRACEEGNTALNTKAHAASPHTAAYAAKTLIATRTIYVLQPG